MLVLVKVLFSVLVSGLLFWVICCCWVLNWGVVLKIRFVYLFR